MTIEKIADGAYFVTSYSVSTLEGYQGGVTNQGVSVSDHVETPGEMSPLTPNQESRSPGAHVLPDDPLGLVFTP